MIPDFSPALGAVADTIQTAIAPVFLLAGIGSMLNVFSGRLARVVDRVRGLEIRIEQDEGLRDRYGAELGLLYRRMSVINAALFLSVTSAVAICALVAMLFVAELGNFRIGREIAVAFVFAMTMLTAGLVAFMIEVRLSLRLTKLRRTWSAAPR